MFSREQAEPAKRLLDEGQSAKEVAKTLGANHSTIYSRHSDSSGECHGIADY
jgi:DNA invertase Pin-like site-specific DNA recombinase